VITDEAIERILKVVILAAGNDSISDDGKSILLENLGDHNVIDYVVCNAKQLVSSNNLYIVVGAHQEAIRARLGTGFQYIHQEEPRGTGHAVLQLAPYLKDFHGDLLIMYGDTPLFHPDSIRGLLNRHRLRNAQLTLLTAVTDRPYPYGRIIRDHSGHIIDIIEAVDVLQTTRETRELNAGAYVVSADAIFHALEQLTPSPVDGLYRLTDSVHQLMRSGLIVEGYQIYDQDEVRGINTAEDLADAEFILRKRLFRPRRTQEEDRVTFGTGGWRAVIGEGFTMYNVRRLAQALANEAIRCGQEKRGVLIGYDHRFLSDRAAEVAAEVFAGNNVPVTLLAEAASTPLVTYATAYLNSVYGLAVTSSHNPPEWNGLKIFVGDGSLLLDEDARRLEIETNRMRSRDVVKLDLDLALETGIVSKRDITNEYVDAVEKLIDLDAIRAANLKIIADTMYGVGQPTLGIILTEARCRVRFLHDGHNPLFGGRPPAPDPDALRLLITYIQERGYDLGLALDGDADRLAIVDENGRYTSTNDILLLCYWYMHEVRGERGGVVRNLSTTHLLDRLAAHFGEKCYEVPVGFKHIAAGMTEHNALMGGESSGGLTVRGHILGKDGVFASALVIEMLARTRKPLSQLLGDIWKITGRLHTREENIPATPDMRVAVPKRLQEVPIDTIGSYPVVNISHLDGTKILLENDNWALLRFSGTEPVLRFMVEADSPEKARELINWLKQFCSSAG
jgi:phosphomannomutase/choline kinase